MKAKNVLFLLVSLFSLVVLSFPTLAVSPKNSLRNKNTKFIASTNLNLFIASTNLNLFIDELNKLGKDGYRVEKSIKYQTTFAAYLILDSAKQFQYEIIGVPDKNLIADRLNTKANEGYSVVNAFPVKVCGESDFAFDFASGDIFLLEKINNVEKQIKEYRAVTSGISLLKDPTKTFQTELDNLPNGFRPIKILFSKSGLVDISLSILLEKDLEKSDVPTIQYKFIKKNTGFEKEVNVLGSQGFRLISGRRVGIVNLALLTKENNDKLNHTMIEQKKFEKDFLKKTSLGNIYEGVFPGDIDCDSGNAVNDKFFFLKAPDNAKTDYKILSLLIDKQSSGLTDESLTELNLLLDEKYKVRDLFYFNGLKVILEK